MKPVLAGSRAGWILIAGLLLAGCGLIPQAPSQPAPKVLEPEVKTLSPLEENIQDRARALTQEENWYEAALQWEVLALLRPEVSVYERQRKACQARARQAATRHLAQAAEFQQAGQTDEAIVAYLRALRQDPASQKAMESLRALETDNLKRGYMAKGGRAWNAARRIATHGSVAVTPVYGASRQVLDEGVLLYRQGDSVASIRTLERYLRGDPQDETAMQYLELAHVQLARQQIKAGRREEALASLERAQAVRAGENGDIGEALQSLRKSLADEYYQKGMRIYAKDLDQAITYWEQSLQFNPEHPQAGSRLQQARKAQRRLKELNAPAKP